MDICGKCMGTGVAGHPDGGYTCDCTGGMTDPTPTRAEDAALEVAAQVADACPDSHWGPWIARRIRALRRAAPTEGEA